MRTFKLQGTELRIFILRCLEGATTKELIHEFHLSNNTIRSTRRRLKLPSNPTGRPSRRRLYTCQLCGTKALRPVHAACLHTHAALASITVLSYSTGAPARLAHARGA